VARIYDAFIATFICCESLICQSTIFQEYHQRRRAKGELFMKHMNIIISCVRCATFAFGFAVVATSAVAQNLEGPGASNYGAGSGPQTGGVVSPTPNSQIETPSGQKPNLYNYARPQQGAGPAAQGRKVGSSKN
jgi:hypothetical protein